MSLLLPGYPKANPILQGIEGIARGLDPETALARRDAALADPADFAAAALQASAFLPPDSPLLPLLVDQATAAFTKLPAFARAELIAQAHAAAGTPGPDALLARWQAAQGQP